MTDRRHTPHLLDRQNVKLNKIIPILDLYTYVRHIICFQDSAGSEPLYMRTVLSP